MAEFILNNNHHKINDNTLQFNLKKTSKIYKFKY